MSINRVVISGNLTRDGELRSTGGGMSVLRLGVAVNNRRKNQQTGEWEDEPTFVDCTLFGRRADGIAQFMKKGTKVAIEGRLHMDSWQDKQGNNRNKLEVYVDNIDFMSPRNSGGYNSGANNGYGSNNYGSNNSYGSGNGGYQQQAPASQPTSAPSIDASSSVYEDDIPF